LDKITPVVSWFVPLGIPSAAVGMPAIWAIYLLFRFLKTNLWHKSAATVFIAGAVNLLIGYQIDVILEAGPISISTVLSSAGCAIIAVALFLLGRKWSHAKRAEQVS